MQHTDTYTPLAEATQHLVDRLAEDAIRGSEPENVHVLPLATAAGREEYHPIERALRASRERPVVLRFEEVAA